MAIQKHIYEAAATSGVPVLKALASETRTKILDLLADSDRNINELAQLLAMSQPTITKHINILETAGLVRSEYSSGTQGTQKRCRLVYDRFTFNFTRTPPPALYIEEIEMPIGLFSNARPIITCGMANSEHMIAAQDQPQAFFLQERSQAQILWSAGGYVEYIFANTLPMTSEIKRLEFSMEVCSEAKDFDLDYPSDISVWVNNVELGVWTSPGDMGGKRGRLNPEWWPPHGTQYGFLKTWAIDEVGSYVDNDLVSQHTIADLRLSTETPIKVRVGNKLEAIHLGGFNIFGRGFGNYDQDLILRLHYTGAHRRTQTETPEHEEVHKISDPATLDTANYANIT